jgi:hypothetical protein
VRVSRRTVLAKRGAVVTHAVEPLVYNHAVAFAQITHLKPNRDYFPRNLVTEDLRLPRERNRLPSIVSIVVGLPSVNMQVGAAEPHGADAHKQVTRAGPLTRWSNPAPATI